MVKTASKITIKLTKSMNGTTEKVKSNVRGLGLRKVGQISSLENSPSVRGMIKKVIHMLEIRE